MFTFVLRGFRPGYRDTGLYRDTWPDIQDTSGYMDNDIQGYTGYIDNGIHGYTGYMDNGIQGY